jgi:hypothetical protein
VPKYKLRTTPGGSEGPQVGLTIKVSKTAPPVVAETVACEPLLGLTTKDPTQAYDESTLFVYIGAALSEDLEVTVRSPDVDTVAFPNTDSIPAFDADTYVATILAGDTSVEVPFLPVTTSTGITLTATALGYDDAAFSFAIDCTTTIYDIVVWVGFSEQYILGGPLIASPASPVAELLYARFLKDDFDGPPSNYDANEMTYYATTSDRLQVIQVMFNLIGLGRLCPGTTLDVSCVHTGTGPDIVATHTYRSNHDASPMPLTWEFGAVGPLYFVGGIVQFTPGDKYVFTVLIDGVQDTSLLRSTFTINIGAYGPTGGGFSVP